MYARIQVRKAPYAPIGALHAFLSTIQNIRCPSKIDARFLKSKSIARGNEAAFISALKYLAILDERGVPTAAFRKMQGRSESSIQTLAHLVRIAYVDALEAGALLLNDRDLAEWFAETSSQSQSRNAVRFFRELCTICNISLGSDGVPENYRPSIRRREPPQPEARNGRLKTDLLDKIPAYGEWKGTAEEYVRALEIWDRLITGARPRRQGRNASSPRLRNLSS